MEARVFLVCLCVAVIVRGEQAPTGLCRSNERLLMCGCPKTCRDPAPDCKAVCRPGCFCEEGQVRNDEGICVNLADCPPILSAYKQDTSEPRPNGGKCPDNEEYRYCEPCNKTCDNPNPICPAQCSRGCFCNNGLLRDVDGTCVTPDKCSKTTSAPNATQHEMTCGKHQVYKHCETREKTCRKPNPRVLSPCIMGCFCEEGYVKASNGQCVKLEECSKGSEVPNLTSPTMGWLRQSTDQSNTTMNLTSTTMSWLRQSSNQTQATNLGQTTPAQIQYPLLIDPMVHDSQPSLHEPSVEDCSPDEVYFFCGWCEPSCSNPVPSCPNKVCMRGCQCRPPLLRHHTGRCVDAKDCFPGSEVPNLTSPTMGWLRQSKDQSNTTMNLTSTTMSWLRQSSNQTQATNHGETTPAQIQYPLLLDPMVHDSQPSLHDPSVEDCSPDEVYFFCGWCEPSCSNPVPSCPNKVCMRGCQCRPPLLRHHTGRCVDAKDCFPENCNNLNEEFLCLFGCEQRCDGRVCVQPRYCVLGCYCRMGLLRDTTGLCVLKDRCTNSTEVKGVPINLKKKLSNDERVYKSLTWKSQE